MVCRIKHGTGFPGVLLYAMKPSKQPEIITSTATTEDPREIAREFRRIAKLSKRTTKPVAHYAFSLADGERLSSESWAKVVEKVVTELGADAYIAVRHRDTEHDHIHLILCRVCLSGKAWDDSNERRRIRRVCMQIEQEMGLTPTREKARKAPPLTKQAIGLYPIFNHMNPSKDHVR